jgi:hypothetical protein
VYGLLIYAEGMRRAGFGRPCMSLAEATDGRWRHGCAVLRAERREERMRSTLRAKGERTHGLEAVSPLGKARIGYQLSDPGEMSQPRTEKG